LHASKAEEGDARVEEDDRGLEMVVEGDQEVVHNHKVVGVVLEDDGDDEVVVLADDDDEVVVAADDRSQDVVEAVADHTYVAGVVEVAVDVYGRTLFF
jgi:hypothetical protein